MLKTVLGFPDMVRGQMTTQENIQLFLDPLQLFSAASLVIKCLVLVNCALSVCDVVVFLTGRLNGKSLYPFGFPAVLIWMGLVVSVLGFANEAYVFFVGMRSEPLPWPVHVVDLLITAEAGLLTALVGIVGSRLLRRNT